MSIYAVIQNNIVVNTVVWDGVSEWTPPVGTLIVEIKNGIIAGIDYGYDKSTGVFTAPEETTVIAS